MSIFRGSGVAIVTPFQNGSIDFTAFTRLIELQIANRTDSIICCGTTGESSTLTVDERLSVIQFVVERVNGRVPVIAGTGAALMTLRGLGYLLREEAMAAPGKEK